MKKITQLLSNRIARFIVVGLANATISFGILNITFYKFHQGKIVSSIIATTCALIFSFILNRHYVFSDKSRRIHRQLALFVVVTISGSLLLLNMVYVLTLKILNGHEDQIIRLAKNISGITFTKNFIGINLSTVVGAIAALVWNYNGYRLFVFKGSKLPHEVAEDEE